MLWPISRGTAIWTDGADCGPLGPGTNETRRSSIWPSPAGALLEACVYIAANDISPSYILELAVPDTITVESVGANSLPQNLDATRAIGSEWLLASRSAPLRVPSVIVPATYHVLMNPTHPEARHIEVTRALEYPFDVRLRR